jgi:hypothetical protein
MTLARRVQVAAFALACAVSEAQGRSQVRVRKKPIEVEAFTNEQPRRRTGKGRKDK